MHGPHLPALARRRRAPAAPASPLARWRASPLAPLTERHSDAHRARTRRGLTRGPAGPRRRRGCRCPGARPPSVRRRGRAWRRRRSGTSSRPVRRSAAVAVPSEREHEVLQAGVVADEHDRADVVGDLVDPFDQLVGARAVEPAFEVHHASTTGARAATSSNVSRARRAVEHSTTSGATCAAREVRREQLGAPMAAGASRRSWSASAGVAPVRLGVAEDEAAVFTGPSLRPDPGPRPVCKVGARGVPVALPQVPAPAVLRARRSGARHQRPPQRRPRRPGRSCLPLLRAARHRQDDDGADPGQGPQLYEPRRRRRALRRVRQLPGDRRGHLHGPPRDRRRLEPRRRRRPRPPPEGRDGPRREHPPQGLHPRRSPHALDRSREHAAEDARGAARARRVRARDHQPRERPADDPFAHPALRVHAPVDASSSAPTSPTSARARASRPAPRRWRSSPGPARVRSATRCRSSTRLSRTARASSTPPRSPALFGGAPFELRARILARDRGRGRRRPRWSRSASCSTPVTSPAASPTTCCAPRATRSCSPPAAGACTSTRRSRTRSGSASSARRWERRAGARARDARSGRRRHARYRRRRSAPRARGRARPAEPPRRGPAAADARRAHRAAGAGSVDRLAAVPRHGGTAATEPAAGGRFGGPLPRVHVPRRASLRGADPRSARCASRARAARAGHAGSERGDDGRARRRSAPPARSISTTSSSRGRRSCPSCPWRPGRRCRPRSPCVSRAP